MFTSESPFSLGANLPWVRYGCDFGANAWHPRGGLAYGGIPVELRARLSALQRRGISAIRWFLFCDGRAGLRFDARGTPLGLDDHVFSDIDAALAFVSDTDLRVMFVLFDFLWCLPQSTVDGVPLQGRRRIWSDPDRRGALLDRVVRPLFERYGRHPNVCAWDVVNEPEWVTFGLGTWNPWASVSTTAMRSLITGVVGLARGANAHPVTVGLASARGLDLVRDTGLDFYQVHWYDKLDRRAPLATPVHVWKADRPVLLGEYPTRGSASDPAAIVRRARDAGYAGAWLWSVGAADESSDWQSAMSSLQASPDPVRRDAAAASPERAVDDVSRG